MAKLIWLTIAAVAVRGTQSQETAAANSRRLRDALTRSGSYDSDEPPELARPRPTSSSTPSCTPPATQLVLLQLHVENTMVDQLSHEITFIGDVVITWEDWRLRFNGTKDGGCTDHLQFRDSSTLWAPDLFFEPSSSTAVGRR